MSQLRQKLEADPAAPRHLLTEAGMGYRLTLARPARRARPARPPVRYRAADVAKAG